MNEISKSERDVRVTQAAEGLPRWRWTTSELIRLAELGAFTAEDRFELIGGEIVPMSPAGRRHELLSEALEEYFRTRHSPGIRVSTERQFNLSNDTFTKPDLVVRPTTVAAYDLTGADALLVIEIAASSLAYDLGVKAALYARHGVRDYWVVDAATLATTVHRDPGPGGYARIDTVSAGDPLVPYLAPGLSVRLADLDIG